MAILPVLTHCASPSRSLLGFTLLVSALGACGGADDGGATKGDARNLTGDESRAAGGGATAGGATAGGATGGNGGTGGGTGASFDDSAEPSLGEPHEGAGTDVGDSEGTTSAPPDAIASGQLTAGEWRDLEHWDFFQDLFGDEQNTTDWSSMESYWGFETSGRIPVTVAHAGTPIADARVVLQDKNQLTIWEARSDVNGFAELYAGLFDTAAGPFTLVASDGGKETVKEIDQLPTTTERVVIELDGASPAKPGLDLMFMIDTTGSMGDELAYLQAELADVTERVRDEVGQGLSLRLSVNFYRDAGDDYVVQPFAFSKNVEAQLTSLAQQSAGGGGDIPEAVDQALENAVLEHAWSEEATARILFLVLDAPPHHDDQGVLESLHDVTREAAKRGIQIVPVSASGIAKDTEFLLRYLAVATNGSYTFLTDDSGLGGDHLDPGATIGDFQVELLNDLLVRIVSRQLGHAVKQ